MVVPPKAKAKMTPPSKPLLEAESPLRSLSYTVPDPKAKAKAKIVPPVVRDFAASSASSWADMSAETPRSETPRDETPRCETPRSETTLEYWEDVERLKKIDAWVQANWQTTGKQAVCCNFACGHQEFWKLFESVKVWISWEEIKGDKPDSFVWCRTCWKCIMEREGLPDEASARTWIIEHKRDFQQRMNENEAYLSAKKHCLEFFTMLAPRQRHRAGKILEKQGSFVQVFAPLAEAILLKDAQMQEQADRASEAQQLLKNLRDVKNSSQILDAIERVMLLTAATPLIAFKDDPDQRRKWFATTYADEWTGCLGGWFRSWYVCMHNCAWKGTRPQMCSGCCGTLVPSKRWNLMDEEDPLADKQRWYCWQNHRHNASHGQVVELMTVGGRLMYAWTEVPSGTIQDIRAIRIEKECGSKTAEEIYADLPVIPPQVDHGHIHIHRAAPPCPAGQERWFGMEEEFFNDLPYFPWNQIFNFAGAPMQEVKKTGAAAKKATEWEVHENKQKLSRSIAARMGTSAAASEAPW
jgi:hypothetical protein